jgi:hypothetical protein
MSPQADRIAPEITNISSVNQLLSYAAAGQLAQLRKHQPPPSQAKVAYAAGLGGNPRNAGAALSAALRNKGPTDKHLQGLDEIMGALEPDLDGTGSLSSLALRMSGERRDHLKVERHDQIKNSVIAHIPPSWTSKILKDPADDDFGVLIQASALLSAFRAADRMNDRRGSVARLRDRYSNEIALLVPQLILLTEVPPTSHNYDAQILLGSLASYAFRLMVPHLDRELRESPLGFRVWRSVTKLVTLSREENEHTDELKAWVRQLIRDSDELRVDSLYAGRSLDVELAISIPPTWSPPDDDWVGEALFARATNPVATIRERGTAAMGLWQRAIRHERPDIDEIETKLRGLVTELRDHPDRKDAAAGLRWIAATLEQVIDQRTPVCNDWPKVDEPWLQHVLDAAEELNGLGLPDQLKAGTKSLFRHMILQNAGVYRRQAIETMITSGWSGPVIRALEILLRHEPEESWLRIRALFALGFLQRPSLVENVLANACRQAYANLGKDLDAEGAPPRARRTEMHTALFAAGDSFGVPGAERQAKRVRDSLRPVLTGLAVREGGPVGSDCRPIRAAAYMLTATAQPSEEGKKDFSQELLEKLSDHPDKATAGLSKWALDFRFDPDGGTRPFLAAADVPY